MKPVIILRKSVFLFVIMIASSSLAQLPLQSDDPAPKTDVPDFYKTKLSDIEKEIAGLKTGSSKIIAISPGGLPVHAVFYGRKEDLQSRANYNSAIGAGNPVYYAKKDKNTEPVIYFIGPVHGQEVEGIAGMVNLIHVAETGEDYRGKKWPELQDYFSSCRVIIIPCGNPDGRKRNPYNSFVDQPQETMTKYGQGTRKDGTFWRWPDAKSLHPMKENVGILGAYFNDNGINIMHDEFFHPMAEETKAIMQIAIEEAPDITVSLHSCSCNPFIIQNNHAPVFMQKRISALAEQLNSRYFELGLPNMGQNWTLGLSEKVENPPPQKTFNMVSALHYASGTMSFTFESPHGTIEDGATYEEILDIQLLLYREMFDYITNNRIFWGE